MTDELTHSPVMQALLAKFAQEAERVLRREVQAQGLVLTGELHRSIRAGALQAGADFLHASVHYDLLLRLKDLRKLHFARMPPRQAQASFERWVEKHFNEFTHVPGYPGRTPGEVPRGIAVRRIAQGLMFNRRLEPNVVRGYRGVYNDPLKNEILPLFFYQLRQAAGAEALRGLRLLFTDQ